MLVVANQHLHGAHSGNPNLLGYDEVARLHLSEVNFFRLNFVAQTGGDIEFKIRQRLRVNLDDALFDINNSYRPTLFPATKNITGGLFKRGGMRRNGCGHRQRGEDAGRKPNKNTATSLR